MRLPDDYDSAPEEEVRPFQSGVRGFGLGPRPGNVLMRLVEASVDIIESAFCSDVMQNFLVAYRRVSKLWRPLSFFYAMCLQRIYESQIMI